MSYFKTKMHQIFYRLGLRPRPRWGGSLQRSPRPPSWILGGLLLREGRGGRGRDGRGGEGKRKGEGNRGEGLGREATPSNVIDYTYHNDTIETDLAG